MPVASAAPQTAWQCVAVNSKFTCLRTAAGCAATTCFHSQLTWRNAREEPADIGATLRALDERVGLAGPFAKLIIRFHSFR